VDAMPGTRSVRSTVTMSGTNYTASTLAQRVTALMATSPGPSRGVPATPARSVDSSRRTPSSAATPIRTTGTVAEPVVLRACLAALGDHDRDPVAVDLGSYQGREAAVIVLPRQTGGYDVWVVARDCHPGAEGALAFRTVKG
jgi:hypothetical protein